MCFSEEQHLKITHLYFYKTATFYFSQQSFEVTRLSITLTSGNINFFGLYRPPPR